MKRSPMPGRKAPMSRGPATGARKPVAGLRRSRGPDVPLAARQSVHARSGGRCEAMVSPDCTGTATEIHHRNRDRTFNHPDNLVHVCSSCHTTGRAAIHREPALAYRLRLLVHRWEPVGPLRPMRGPRCLP